MIVSVISHFSQVRSTLEWLKLVYILVRVECIWGEFHSVLWCEKDSKNWGFDDLEKGNFCFGMLALVTLTSIHILQSSFSVSWQNKCYENYRSFQEDIYVCSTPFLAKFSKMPEMYIRPAIIYFLFASWLLPFRRYRKSCLGKISKQCLIVGLA